MWAIDNAEIGDQAGSMDGCDLNEGVDAGNVPEWEPGQIDFTGPNQRAVRL